MEIYTIRQGDSLSSIARKYGVPFERLVLDNGLEYPYNLVVGQAIVITYPSQTYVVKEGDSIQSIAAAYNVSPLQILRNNSFLSGRDFLYPGETLTISYNTYKSISVHGFAYPFIVREALLKTLPGLTYLSIFNYSIRERGEIYEYQDDTEIIRLAKEYGVVPLMPLTTLTPQGASDAELSYSILLNEDYQNRLLERFLELLKAKGYSGVNLFFNLLTEDNQGLYVNFTKRISERLREEGLLFFLTINYRTIEIDNKTTTLPINYSALSSYVDGMLFLKFAWGTNYGPPAPVSNINDIRAIVDYVKTSVPADKIVIGIPTIAYDWQLPYVPDRKNASSLSLKSAMALAYDTGAVIHFDSYSQTPFFFYNEYGIGYPAEHIVWMIDARSINSLNKIILENNLSGSGFWNIMIYYPQIWSVINSTFDTIKLI